MLLFLDLVRDFEINVTSEHLWELVDPIMEAKDWRSVFSIFEKCLENKGEDPIFTWEQNFLNHVLIKYAVSPSDFEYASRFTQMSASYGLFPSSQAIGRLIRLSKATESEVTTIRRKVVLIKLGINANFEAEKNFRQGFDKIGNQFVITRKRFQLF